MPDTHFVFEPQQTVLLQQVSVLVQLVLPQQLLPTETQNGELPVLQQVLLPEQKLLPQHFLPELTQKGLLEVVQQTLPLPQVIVVEPTLQIVVWACALEAPRDAMRLPPMSAPSRPSALRRGIFEARMRAASSKKRSMFTPLHAHH